MHFDDPFGGSFISHLTADLRDSNLITQRPGGGALPHNKGATRLEENDPLSALAFFPALYQGRRPAKPMENMREEEHEEAREGADPAAKASLTVCRYRRRLPI